MSKIIENQGVNRVIVTDFEFPFVEETSLTLNGQHTQVKSLYGQKLSASQQDEALADCLENNPYFMAWIRHSSVF